MAGNQNSGGNRPSAPQNNPANVSATGGAGQSGVPNLQYTGFSYGQNQATNQQAASAPMGSPAQAAPAPALGSNGQPLSPLVHLDAPSENPNRPITHGMPFGDGAGPEVIPLPQQIKPDNPSLDIIKALYQQDPRNEDLRYIIESAGNK